MLPRCRAATRASPARGGSADLRRRASSSARDAPAARFNGLLAQPTRRGVGALTSGGLRVPMRTRCACCAHLPQPLSRMRATNAALGGCMLLTRLRCCAPTPPQLLLTPRASSPFRKSVSLPLPRIWPRCRRSWRRPRLRRPSTRTSRRSRCAARAARRDAARQRWRASAAPGLRPSLRRGARCALVSVFAHRRAAGRQDLQGGCAGRQRRAHPAGQAGCAGDGHGRGRGQGDQDRVQARNDCSACLALL